MLELWEGVQPQPREDDPTVLCVSSDLPATRKVCQFKGHTHKANKCCSKCKFKAKVEPGTAAASGRMNYLTKKAAAASTNTEVTEQAHAYLRA